jgi:hypothetical protein
MSFEYINQTYGLNVGCWTRVRYTGGKEPREGMIVGASGQYLIITFDGDKKASGPFHPTWKLEILPPSDQSQPRDTGEQK